MLYGVTLIKDGNRLGYPYNICIHNLLECCDFVFVATDVNSKDCTIEALDFIQCHYMDKLKVVHSEWDMSINMGKVLADKVNECIARIKNQPAAVLYVQADEIVEPEQIRTLRDTVDIYNHNIYLERSYFWGDLKHINLSWTMPLLRMSPVVSPHPFVGGDGMFMVGDKSFPDIYIPNDIARIYHYSRVGETKKIATRLNNLDTLFHTSDEYTPLEDYSFGKNNNFETGADSSNIIEVDVQHPGGIEVFYGLG